MPFLAVRAWGLNEVCCHVVQPGALAQSKPVWPCRVQSPFLSALLADARLAPFLADGTLQLVLWEGVAECGKGARLKCWQPVLYSHAILAAWGTNAYLSLADHDEYLALSAGGPTRRVQDLISICGGHDTQARPACVAPALGSQQPGYASPEPLERKVLQQSTGGAHAGS